MKIIDRWIDRKFAEALSRRYEIQADPPMVSVAGPISRVDIAIMGAIAATIKKPTK